MPYFRDYVRALDGIFGDTEGDVKIYLYLAIHGHLIQGDGLAKITLPELEGDGEAAFANKMELELGLEVYGGNTTNGRIDLPNLTVEAEAEIYTAVASIALPSLSVDGILTFNPWGEITLPELEVDGFGNPNRVYDLCVDTNQGI